MSLYLPESRLKDGDPVHNCISEAYHCLRVLKTGDTNCSLSTRSNVT